MEHSMDRKIEQKKGIRRAFTKKALPFWGGALLLVFILWLIFRDDSKKLRIDADNITVSTVTSGEFNDYIRRLSPRKAAASRRVMSFLS